jgi:hypothetical protein
MSKTFCRRHFVPPTGLVPAAMPPAKTAKNQLNNLATLSRAKSIGRSAASYPHISKGESHETISCQY